MKAVIIYGSHHHGSTKKLAQAITERYGVEIFDAEAGEDVDLEAYDLIGFASGIDFGEFYPAVTAFAERLPAGKAVFALYTCAKDNAKYGEQIRDIAQKRGCVYLGKYGCKGYNTYGPWKIIGGMNKNHPTREEIEGALRFYQGLAAQMENGLS